MWQITLALGGTKVSSNIIYTLLYTHVLNCCIQIHVRVLQVFSLFVDNKNRMFIVYLNIALKYSPQMKNKKIKVLPGWMVTNNDILRTLNEIGVMLAIFIKHLAIYLDCLWILLLS